MASYTSTGNEEENSNRCNVTHATNTGEFQTIDMSELYFSFQDPETVMHNISANLTKQGVQRDTVLNVFKNLKQFRSSDDDKLLDVAIRYHQQPTSPVSYQIVDDNVDLEVKVRHMTKTTDTNHSTGLIWLLLKIKFQGIHCQTNMKLH